MNKNICLEIRGFSVEDNELDMPTQFLSTQDPLRDDKGIFKVTNPIRIKKMEDKTIATKIQKL